MLRVLFERFRERARQVVVPAQEEHRRLQRREGTITGKAISKKKEAVTIILT